MNEIPNVLESKEKVEWEGKPQGAPYFVRSIFVSVIFGGFLGLILGALVGKQNPSLGLTLGISGGIFIFILGIVISILSFNALHYTITNKRAIIQSGIIGRDFKSIDYDRMQNVSVSVGLLGLIFKVGNIKIFTGEIETVRHGRNGSQTRPKYDVFKDVSEPYPTLKHLQEHLSQRKEDLYAGRT